MVSGSAMFVVAYLVLGIAARFARRLGPRENTGRSPRDRFLGATFGAVRGALLAMMVVYLAMWFDALRATGAAAVLPEIGDSVAADVTSGVVQSAIESAVDTSRARRALHGALRGAARGLGGRAPGESSTIRTSRELRGDARFWNDVEDGNLDAALQRSSFHELAQRCAAAAAGSRDLGLVTDEAALDAESVPRNRSHRCSRRSGRGCAGCTTTPPMQELLADPAVVAMLENGDTLGLLAHPKFRELVSRVSGGADRES